MRNFVHVKFACILGILIFTSMSLSAIAQSKMNDKSSSRFSVFGGYSFLYYSNGTDTSLYGSGDQNHTEKANGFVASAAYNLSSNYAIVGEYGFYHADSLSNTTVPSGASITTNLQTYLFGPKVSFHNGPVTPFVQVLFGGIHGTVKGSATSGGISVSVTEPGASAFAWAAGGGLDWKLTPHLSIRPAQFEYLMSRFSNTNTIPDFDSGNFRLGDLGNGTQNNFRYSAGVVYNF